VEIIAVLLTIALIPSMSDWLGQAADIALQQQFTWTAMNDMSSVSVTVGGDCFACVPSLVCRGRVTLVTCFACCAVSIHM
jgi:hypothetical protein